MKIAIEIECTYSATDGTSFLTQPECARYQLRLDIQEVLNSPNNSIGGAWTEQMILDCLMNNIRTMATAYSDYINNCDPRIGQR